MTQDPNLSFLQGQKDPIMFLLQNSITTQNGMVDEQASFSQNLEDASNGAAKAISAANNYLQALADNLSAATTPNEMTCASTQYNVQQTIVSNNNNSYSNVMQGLGTVVSDGTPAQQFVLQFCQSTVDFMNGVDQCVRSWTSG